MAVTDTGDIIKVDFESGDTYGDSYDNAWNRQRIYDAIQADGSIPNSVMVKMGNIYFMQDRALHIGTDNSNTYFFDDDGGALIWQGSVSDGHLFYNKGYCKINGLSAISEISSKRFSTKNCQETILIDSKIKNFNYVRAQNIIHDIVDYNNIRFIIDYGANDFTDITTNQCGSSLWKLSSLSSSFLRLKNQNATYSLILDCRFNLGTITFERIQSIDCSNDIRYYFGGYDIITNVINSKLDVTSYIISGTSDGSITNNFQNYFQIYIQNGANASAILKDKDGNEIISGTLDANGEWLLTDPVTWVQRYLETADGSIVKNELNYKEPFNLEVTKNGLQDLTIPNIYSSIYDKNKNMRIGSLEDTVVEGQMVGKNYVEGRLKEEIKEDKIQFQLVEETITFNAYD